MGRPRRAEAFARGVAQRGGQQPYQLLGEPVVDVCPPGRQQPAVGEFRPGIDVDRRHAHRPGSPVSRRHDAVLSCAEVHVSPPRG